jgi:hypothetical protein
MSHNSHIMHVVPPLSFFLDFGRLPLAEVAGRRFVQ